MLKNNKKYQSIDGFARSLEDERDLNQTFASVFSDPAGKKVLQYLKNISINAVSGPEIDANALFHKEGMRFVVGIIEARITKHNKENKNGWRKYSTRK